MKHLKPIILIFLFAGCEEYFVPNVDSVQPVYAFEGYVTSQPGPYCIRVMRSNGYNTDPQIEFVPDASVAIECKDGQIYKLTHDSAGCYYTDSAEFVGRPNLSYRLKVETADGKQFLSEYEQMPPCPDIEEISARYYEKKTVRTDGTNYFDEIENGLQVMNTTDAYGQTPYYRYDCQLILQSQQRYSNPPMAFDLFIYRPVNSYGKLFIANANDYVDKRITGNQLFCTSKKMLKYADYTLVEDMEFDVKNYGEFVKVTQYSMTEAQYNFWKAVSNQTENKNYIFGQIEYQVVGNIKCTSNPEEPALGFFGASAAKSKIRAFSLRDDNNVVCSYDINYFPATDTTIVWESMPNYLVWFSN